MTSFKDIKFGRSDFPIQPGDIVTVKAEGSEPAFKFEVLHVFGFTLHAAEPVTLTDGMVLKEITIVDHGFDVTHVNGKPFKSFTQSPD
jgi:hypothetical protein